MANEEVPTPKHLKWSIEGRARNQQTSLKLYELMKEHKNRIRKLNLSGKVQELVAVSFSLWRAVFLADRTGTIEAKMEGAEVFLAKILTDNAVAFAQDRNAREWTFNYYLDNALFRLENYRKFGHRNELKPAKGSRTPRKRWDHLQVAFESEVAALGKKLTAKRSS
ncbi:MAG: hypothetical protein QOJ96_1851 [Alphaproteobacteria bacterium]|jgi:hypothetical protein|nr:hypothetical protein [Alphaproteobacteria bacterium]